MCRTGLSTCHEPGQGGKRVGACTAACCGRAGAAGAAAPCACAARAKYWQGAETPWYNRARGACTEASLPAALSLAVLLQQCLAHAPQK
jgi:hypothetical protein